MASLLEAAHRQKAILAAHSTALGRLSSVEEKCDLAWSLSSAKENLLLLCGSDGVAASASQKNGAESESWRGRGNGHFQAGKLESALGCYTEAVLAAPARTQVVLDTE
jgi:hypothetical protein